MNVGTDETVPWHRCTTSDECFDWIMDDGHPVQFVVTFQTMGRYLMMHKSTCGT